jgi:replicative DNA helicase
MLRDNTIIADVASILCANDFYHDAHRTLFGAITALCDNGKPADLITVADKIKDRIADIGGYGYLAELWEAAPTTANVAYHVNIVKDHARRRALIHASSESLRDAWDCTGPVGEIVEAAQQRVASIAAAPLSNRQEFRYRPVDGAAFSSKRYSREWHVKPLIVADQPVVMGGPRKSLKTSTLIDLALSMTAGVDFLGEFHVPKPLRVCLFCGESGEATVQETYFRVCRARDVDPEILRDNLRLQFDLPKLSNAGHMEELRRGLEKDEVDIVIFDPVYLALLAGQGSGGTQATNLFEMGPLYAGISNVCLDAGSTPILVCHTQRAAARSFDPLELDDLAYAGIGEFARQWLLLSRREQYQHGTGQHKLWLNVGGSAGHGGLWAVDIDEGVVDENFSGRRWSVTVSTGAEKRAANESDKKARKRQKLAEEDHDDDTALLTALDKLDKDHAGFGKNRVQVEARLPNARMGRAVTRLREAGTIVECKVAVEIGKGGKRSVCGLKRAA